MKKGMEPNTNFRDVTELKAGDILLCHCDPSKGLAEELIHNATGSEYCHAAIYYGESLVAESVAKNGIKKGKNLISITCLFFAKKAAILFRQLLAALSAKERL